MKFVDEVEIIVRGGKGGAGVVHFLREKYREYGGPDGGDGGRGGDVYLYANSGMQTLGALVSRSLFAAGNGEPGAAQKCSGSTGEDLIIHVPIGTQVEDTENGEVLGDLDRPEKKILIAHGGKGGLGNQHFANSVNQAPEYAQPGMPGDEKHLRLNLKLIADVGLVGLPNAGKSTLIAAVTRSHPKIADYAFTTLIPNLGMVYGPNFRRLLLADIPGIIEGASRGAGLGLSFLRHIERVRGIVYVIDISSLDPIGELEMLRTELASYSPALLERRALIVLNKMDVVDYDASFAAQSAAGLTQPSLWKDSPFGVPAVLTISAQEKKGTDEFCAKLFEMFPEPTFAELML